MISRLQARLIASIDDRVCHLAFEPKTAVALGGAIEDIVVLGLLSLYKREPVVTYSRKGDVDAMFANQRFGAHGKFCDVPEGDYAALRGVAHQDGLKLISGERGGPGPFDAQDIDAILSDLPEGVAVKEFLFDAFRPLIGTRNSESHSNLEMASRGCRP